MNKRRIYIGVAIVLTSVISFSQINKNTKDIDYTGNVKAVFPLIRTNDAILFMAQNSSLGFIDNKISYKIEEEIILEEVKIEEIKEEKQIEEKMIDEDIIVAKNAEENNKEVKETQERKENISNPSRGADITDNRKNKEDLSQHLNNYVLDVIKTYSLGNGNYPYLLNDDFQNYNGVTEDLYYGGELILKANPNGDKSSHCTGITFEVFFKAMQNRNKALGIDINNFNGMSKDELHDFILTWYVALGAKSESNLAVAIEKYGLGSEITNMEDLRPGDFIDLSRENNSGHAVIFMNWIREGNKIIGLRHWSSQGSTNGISYKEEYFNIKGSNGKKYGNVIIDNLHMVRINPVNEYKRYK